MRGIFITFEGGEGSGKSTQARLLRDALATPEGLCGVHDVVLTREPGGSKAAESIRRLLLDPELGHVGKHVETLLLYAARDDHLTAVIRPALDRGTWVLCDRFIDSTRAYQGAAGETEPSFIAELERAIVKDNVPDLTFVMDLPADEGLRRARDREPGRQDQFEQRNLEFHKLLRTAYRTIAQEEPQRCRLIDASQDVETIHRKIMQHVVDKLGAKG